MLVRASVLVLAFAVAACPSDLDRFELVCDGAHSTGDDGGGGGGGDGQALWDGVVAECACGSGSEIPAGCAACDCPMPAVLMLVDSRSGSAPTDGKVMLYSLATQSACGELSGGETLPSSVSTVAWIPPATIAVGSDPDVIRAINPRYDDYRWVYDPPCCAGGWPRDVFWLEGPSGETYTAAAYTLDQGYDDIRYVEAYDAAGARVDGWNLNDTASPLKLGLSIYGMKRSPLDPKQLLLFKSGTYAAATIGAPFDGEDVYPTTYHAALPSGTPDTIHAIRQGDLSRVTWVSGAFSDDPESIYYTSDTGSGPMVAGPLRCDAQCTVPARFYDAVPDPADPTGVIAVCFADETGGRAHVVRLNRAGDCSLVLDGNTLPPLQRPIRLDVAY
jgi:hypothetical protein